MITRPSTLGFEPVTDDNCDWRAVVGVFPDGAKSEEAAAFTAAGTALRNDYDFGLITDASLLAEAKG